MIQHEDDILYFVGLWNGTVMRHSLLTDGNSKRFDRVFRNYNEARVFSIKAFGPESYFAANHNQETAFYNEGQTYSKADKDEQKNTS